MKPIFWIALVPVALFAAYVWDQLDANEEAGPALMHR